MEIIDNGLLMTALKGALIGFFIVALFLLVSKKKNKS